MPFWHYKIARGGNQLWKNKQINASSHTKRLKQKKGEEINLKYIFSIPQNVVLYLLSQMLMIESKKVSRLIRDKLLMRDRFVPFFETENRVQFWRVGDPLFRSHDESLCPSVIIFLKKRKEKNGVVRVSSQCWGNSNQKGWPAGINHRIWWFTYTSFHFLFFFVSILINKPSPQNDSIFFFSV